MPSGNKGKGRSFFALRWGREFPADPEFLGMIEEKILDTGRRSRIDHLDIEKLQVAVLGVCSDVISTLLGEDSHKSFRLDMTIVEQRVTFLVACRVEELPDGVATGRIGPHGPTARLLELEGLAEASRLLDEAGGELEPDGTLRLRLSHSLPSSRRDPPVYG